MIILYSLNPSELHCPITSERDGRCITPEGSITVLPVSNLACLPESVSSSDITPINSEGIGVVVVNH